MGFLQVHAQNLSKFSLLKPRYRAAADASALVGAVGTALGNMVGSLTVGKKKYADVEDEMWELKAKCDQLRKISFV